MVQQKGEDNLNKLDENELKPKSDIIFKNLFSKVGNEDMLKELLEEIIKIKIEEIEVQKSSRQIVGIYI